MTKSETRREKLLAHCTPEQLEALDKARLAFAEASDRLDAVRAEAVQKHADYLTLWQGAVKPLPEREWMLAGLIEDAAMRDASPAKRGREREEDEQAALEQGRSGTRERRARPESTRGAGFIHPLT